MIRQILIASTAAMLAVAPALAAPQRLPLRATVANASAVLKPDITAMRDILTLGDLVAGLPALVASQPAFRAPALGETGTIQASRVLEAVRAQGIETISDGGHGQVVVTRAARRLGLTDIEVALKRAIEERYGIDTRALSFSVDNGQASVVVEPDLKAGLQVQDLVYDSRSRRLAATLVLPGSAALRLRPVRIAGQMAETVEVIVPLRTINRGEILQAGDITLERRPRETATSDIVVETTGAIGKAARRQLSPGQPLRQADLQRHEIIARNEIVTVVYEAPGLMLTMRGRAQDSGAQGDLISVMNVQSKKILQGVVIGAGRVAVNGAASGRVAAAN